MSKNLIDVEAESIEEAREKAKSLTPSGGKWISEQVTSDGKPQTVQCIADTVEDAFVSAQNEIPKSANIVEKKVITTPKTESIIIEGVDESSARWQIRSKYGNAASIKDVELLKKGSKGIFGVGAKLDQYELTIIFLASVEITYKSKARLTIEVGDFNIEDLEASGDIRSLSIVLNYDNKYDSIAAAAALARIGGNDAVEALTQALESPKINSRLAAALTLAKMNDERAIESLITILENNTDFTVQLNAIEALESLGNLKAIKPLVDVVVIGQNNTVVDRAMKALLKLDHLPAIELLVVALKRKDEDYHIRMKAAAMLGHLKNDHATDHLITALQDEVWNVRATAAWALGEIGDSRAIQPLNSLIQDSNYTVQKEAKQALASIERSVSKKAGKKKAAKPIIIDANHTERGAINLRIKGGEPNASYEITYADGTKHTITTDENGRALDYYSPFSLTRDVTSGEILINPGGYIIKSKFSQYPGFKD